jgi:AcrR family transcriptional regulator
MSVPGTPPRPLRADAQRNRRRLLAAAREVLAERGLDASTGRDRARGGVGVGTLYRRFPTKDDLVEAAMRELTEHVIADVRAAGAHPDPWLALAGALDALAAGLHENQAFFDAVRPRLAELDRMAPLRDELREAFRPVFDRAHAARVLRPDVVLTDVPLLVLSAARLVPRVPGADPQLWRRYFGVLLDGLRPGAATPLPLPPPES